MRKKAAALVLILMSGLCFASDQSPYAGEENRSIKSLSDREIQALKAGKGMGLGKVAELNEYPGPRHVLEMADELELSSSQLADTQKNFADMKVNAIAVGKKLLAAEAALEQSFRDGAVDAQSLAETVQNIGRLRAELRFVHLAAHLEQKQILSDAQVEKYVRHRGYRSEKHHGGRHQKQGEKQSRQVGNGPHEHRKGRGQAESGAE
ncbi:MAG: hypothetical protein QNJ19_04055 [Woeseiaceae bacterium]|nr:hypothetical protein [Woeseiaceae bacterium]